MADRADISVAGAPVIETNLGPVRGVALGGPAAAFRGIPFAAPPVGPLRWREAQPAKPWTGVLDATAFGPVCPQQPSPGEPLPQDEDCLTLNIVTPDVGATGLPVLFSIHGGAYFIGSGRYIADKDLSPIVRRGVVLVSANYRLGRFGFFAHPALSAEAGRGTGNFWLSDQISALEWVRRNIAAFGGDPANVTILGCSAGGSSVNTLVTVDKVRHLFTRAASHSGGGLFNAARSLKRAEEQGVAFARRAGIDDDDPDVLDKLRALTVEQIIAADPGAPDYGAIIDSHWIEKPVGVAFAEGERSAVPMIIGSTSNEASIFGMMGFDAATLKARFDIDLDELRPVYEAEGALSEAELLRRVQTDFLFTAASLGIGSFAARTAPTWSYHFDYVPAAQRATKPGASHCADMPYTFLDDARRTPEDQAVADRQQAYWYNFIAGGDPNGDGLPAWPQAAPGAVATMMNGDTVEIVPALHRDRMAYWYERWMRETGVTVRP
ncbi:carboxylesterase/lipase family protein [Sphingomonas crocodyli]|uniref:Carboxylic ester hydrolase n=1 Tax=Sphingomonas crocodyli TaxID=1979270 RepID=A0A437M6T5_9SPHN|nr:carboxylesterase family protein [Sphingomonas crocodyli]RVT93276.1 carboxylesterase/lipase family protein [Sphingomonas crocodyli]